jgi:hypothetical protein
MMRKYKTEKKPRNWKIHKKQMDYWWRKSRIWKLKCQSFKLKLKFTSTLMKNIAIWIEKSQNWNSNIKSLNRHMILTSMCSSTNRMMCRNCAKRLEMRRKNKRSNNLMPPLMKYQNQQTWKLANSKINCFKCSTRTQS